MKPRLSLDLLRQFHAAARHLSFTRAAQELNLTQSAVSRAVRTLEEQLGCALFHRVNRALQLTRAGQQIFAACDDALRSLDVAVRAVTGSTRTLSVTTTVALASTWLVPRLPRFTQSHSEFDMRIVASNDRLDLDREQIDVAIRYVPPEEGPRSGDKLFDYHQFPVCAPALLRDAQRPLRSPADLARHVLLDFETRLYARPWSDWERWRGACGLLDAGCAGLLRFSHYDQIVEAAIKGSGVMIGKRPHLTDHLRAGTLVAPFGTAAVAQVGGFYIEVARAAERAPVELFLAWLRAQWRADMQDAVAGVPLNGCAEASAAPPRSPRSHRRPPAPGR